MRENGESHRTTPRIYADRGDRTTPTDQQGREAKPALGAGLAGG